MRKLKRLDNLVLDNALILVLNIENDVNDLQDKKHIPANIPAVLSGIQGSLGQIIGYLKGADKTVGAIKKAVDDLSMDNF